MQVPLCKPSVGKEELAAIESVFKEGALSHGSAVPTFEASFSTRIGVKHSIAVNSCASGLYLSCEYIKETMGVGEIILPSFTFVASVNAVLSAGMIPRFVDVEWETGNTNAVLIETAINQNTKAIMPVHYAGRPCEMIAIMQLANKYNLRIIEDSAECLGAKIGVKEAGSFDIGVFSFYSTKNITTGEGGMITTDDEAFAEWCRIKLAHGISKNSYTRDNLQKKWFRNAVMPGQNFRLSNLQAAIGLVQLEKLDRMNVARRAIAAHYCEALGEIPLLEIPELLPIDTHSWQMFPIKVAPKNRDRLLDALNENGIGASAHFDPPVHWQTLCHNIPKDILPITEKLALSTITLPISPIQTYSETQYVIDNLMDVCVLCEI